MLRAMQQLRIGLIGCGRIVERVHLPTLVRLDGVVVAALAETDVTRLQDARRGVPDARWFTDYGELLEHGGLEAVVICVPPFLHAKAAIAAFERGLHVYLEKPIATTVDDATRIVAAWRLAGTQGQIGFNFRFHPLVVQLREALRNGVLGEIVGVRTVFCGATRAQPEWKRQRSTGGGAPMELASHHVDLARFLFDQEVVEVGAALRSIESENDTASIDLRLADGPLVTIFTSLSAIEEDRIEVYGSRGALVFDRYRSSRLRFVPAHRDFRRLARLRASAATLAALPRTLRDVVSPPPERSYALAFAAFARAVQNNCAAAPNLDDGLRSLAVVAAAERAASSGRCMTLAAETSAATSSQLRTPSALGGKA